MSDLRSDSNVIKLEEIARRFASETTSRLKSGDGGGTFDGMERIAKLEARADSTDQRLGRIEDKLDRVIEKLGGMPTTNGLWGMVATVLGVGIAIAGLTFAIASYASH